jgi:cobalt-precorrin-7 (C5)-methyltransferase
MIYIVGLGPGHKDYIMVKALEILKKSDVIIGFKRAIDSLEFIDNKKIYISKLSDIDKFISCDENQDIDSEIITRAKDTNISIVASGDPTFYGITNYIKSKIGSEIEVIPGISSFQYLTCKLKLPWNNAYLGSLHGRKEEFLDKVNNYGLSIWLTDKDNNPAVLSKILHEAEIKCKVIVGENLSYEDEIISEGEPKKFLNANFSPLSIYIVSKS